LRQEIEPVSGADFIRFLLAWQKVAPDTWMEGPESVKTVIEQLEGFEAPAAAWEGELLPSRVVDYDPSWLDALCLSGEVVWARLTPLARSASDNGERSRGSGPVRNTPIALLRRKNFSLWSSVFPQPTPASTSEFSTTTQTVYDYLQTRGASFFTDIVENTDLLRSQVEEALAELVANGVVVSDSFAGLPACAVSAREATSAIVVSMTLCRVGYFIGRELIRNSGFMSRLFFGVCRSQNRGSPPHTYICAISVPWPGLKKRLPMATPNFKTRRVLRGQPFIIAL